MLSEIPRRITAVPARLMRALAVAAAVTQAGISVTGSVVRVTGSGLGCPDWPTCFPGRMFPDPHQDVAWIHQWVEFGNRLLVGLVSAVAIACLVAALGTRPRRRRLTLLAAAMPAGVAAQAVIGGITVLLGLAWWTVSVHFLVSMVLVWLAVLLVDASTDASADQDPETDQDPGAAADGPAGRPVRRLVTVSTVVLAALLTAGTMVTAAGPHAGDADTPRLGLGVPLMAHIHAALLFAYLALLVALGTRLRGAANARTHRAYLLLLTAVLAQGVLGVVQYRLGVPEILVSLHVLGACLVTAAAAGLWTATHPRRKPAAKVIAE